MIGRSADRMGEASTGDVRNLKNGVAISIVARGRPASNCCWRSCLD
jgi:hypothetical protein